MKFSITDLEQFADWSGDRNSLHLDRKFAEQTSFGQPITHGILSVIEAFCQWEKDPDVTVRSLEVEFQGAVFPGKTYSVTSSRDKAHLSVSVFDDSHLVLKAKAHFGSRENRGLSQEISRALGNGKTPELPEQRKRSSPANRTVADLKNGLELTGVYSADLTPNSYTEGSNLKTLELKVLGLCSYLVGMEVPGQRSLFTRLYLDFHQCPADSDHLIYHLRTLRYNEQFRILDMALEVATPNGECVATGEIRSYVPFSPVVTDLRRIQASLKHNLGNLQGKVALVCGGSQGLGAELSASLALAGCHVYVNYLKSENLAKHLKNKLADEKVPLNLLPGDVGDPQWCSSALGAIKKDHGRLDLLVLNACSPPVAMNFDTESVEKFEQYVRKNLRLVQSPLAKFLPILSDSQGGILAISSSFVEEAPSGFGHYVTLKQAVEGLVKSSVKEYPNLSCLIVRPPRLQTRWNDTPTGVHGALPTDSVASLIVQRVNEQWNSRQITWVSDFSQIDSLNLEESEPSDPDFNLVLSASFTAEPLLPGLRFWFSELDLNVGVQITPYGQVLQELLNPASLLSSNTQGMSVILLCIQDWLRELPPEITQSTEQTQSYLSETSHEFIQAIRTHRTHTAVETLLVICPSFSSQTTKNDWLISEVEGQLEKKLTGIPGLQMILAQNFHGKFEIGEQEIEDHLRNKIAHVPYQDGYFHVLSSIIGCKIHQKTVLPRKVIVLDCDNTLWSGVVGEAGVQGIEIAPIHHQLYEALTDLSHKGVLIALCSKNEEEDVWEVFEQREDFGLKRSLVVASMINWNPKSQNIKTLASRLNLGLDSFIFIDDNPVECAEVRAGCPEVLVLEWPQNPEKARKLLEHTWELDRADGTKEDQKRTQLYREEFERQEFQEQALSFEEFIANLELQVDMAPINEERLLRSSQLTLRTNQFNFTTRRRSESEIQKLLTDENYICRTITVSDRFGDYGLVGLFIVQSEAQELLVDTFLVSCRVLGRGVEHHMAAAIGQLALEMGKEHVHFQVITTKRNAPARKFLESISEGQKQRSNEEGIDCWFSANSLAQLRFEPRSQTDKSPKETTKPEKVVGPTIKQGEHLRARERQIFKTTGELSTISGLIAAIDGKGGNDLPTQDFSSSEGVHKDVWEEVYSAFSHSLDIPVEQLKQVDQLEALGCSSFKIVEITVALTAQFPWLPSTLLFEHRSISEIIEKIDELLKKNTHEDQTKGLTLQTSTISSEPKEKGSTATEIAVVGIGLRCAGANSPTELWELLHSGGSSVAPVPDERSPSNSRPHWAGLLDKDRIESFDAEFFGISPREAEFMDPQLRLLLEVAWEGLEDAGYPQPDFETGVYIGAMYEDYVFRANSLAEKSDSPYRCWESFSLANRLSQVLGLSGPSFAVNTACSSSGVALHLACRGLIAGECQTAIVAGVNLILDPNRLAQLDRLGILSATGQCRSFGAEADGTVLGEGAGVVVLMPLSEAIKAGKRIYGIIKGTALSTGTGTVGFTAPNPQAQANAIRQSVQNAGIDPRTISYVEAHGTGTLLGDPIEVRGLTLAYGDTSLWDDHISGPYNHKIASIKPNIGHLEAGAGVFGLIKVLLQFKHQSLVPSLYSGTTNHQIPFEDSPFTVQQKAEPWDRPILKFQDQEKPFARRAGLSSFGVGGANVHLILEEQPEITVSESEVIERPFHILTLSARNEESLNDQVLTFQQFLRSKEELSLEDISYTANIGRKHFEHRLAFLAKNTTQLLETLGSYSSGDEPANCMQGRKTRTHASSKIAFLFTGQGAQYIGMGKTLYETQPVFRATVDQCVEILKPWLNRSILDVMFADKESSDAPLLNQTGYTQPALFVIEYSLAKLWESWGICPEIVIGHSVGEIAALCVAGGVSLEDGLKLTAARGQLMQALPPGGGMASIQAGEAEVTQAILGLENRISIAGLNSPEQTVISGEGDAIDEMVARFENKGIKTKPLVVSHAFHSHLMDPMIDKFQEVVKEISFSNPKVQFASCVKGMLISEEIKDSEYWVQQVRNPVRFTEGMNVLQKQSVATFLEVGPHPVLLGMGKHCLPNGDTDWLPSLRNGVDEWQTLLGSLGKLYVNGTSIDWKEFDAPYVRKIVSIPHYSFRHRSYWIDVPHDYGSATHKVLSPGSSIDQLVKSQDESGFSDLVQRSIKLSPEEAAVLPKVFKALTFEDSREQNEAKIAQHLYRVIWKESLLGEGQSLQDTPGPWVILMDQNGFGDLLAKTFANHGIPYLCVWQDTYFKRNDGGNFSIDPHQSNHYTQMWQSIEAEHQSIKGVIHLWGLDAPLSNALEIEDLEHYQAITIGGLLYAAQILALRSGTHKPKIWVITRDAMNASEKVSNEVVSVAQAPLWGFAKTFSLEHADLWGGVLDLSSNGNSDAEAEMVYHALSHTGTEDQLAIRGNKWFVPRLIRDKDKSYRNLVLDDQGSYLITGGLGTLGLHTARWLITKGVKNLILTGRRGLEAPKAKDAVADLENLGANVKVFATDISSAKEVNTLFAEINKSQNPLKGIIHAAGVDALVPIAEMSSQELNDIVAPKIQGAWLLHKQTLNLDLHMFVCFSSISAIWGSSGRAHYGAANAFLDSLAYYRQSLGLPALSVNWGPWKGGGMANEEQLQILERMGNHGLEPNFAMFALESLLFSNSNAQSIVAEIGWDRFRAVFEARKTRPFFAELELDDASNEDTSDPVASYPRWIGMLREQSPEQRTEFLTTLLQKEVAKTLGFENSQDVRLDQGLFDIGMDSLMAIELANRMSTCLGIHITASDFSQPNLPSLSAHLFPKLNLDGTKKREAQGKAIKCSSEAGEREEGLRLNWGERLKAIPPEERVGALAELLREEVAKTLGLNDPKDVRLDRGLFEMGLDSLMAVELANGLRTRLGIQISASDFNLPHLESIAAHLLGQLTVPQEPRNGVVHYSSELESEIFEFHRKAFPERREDWIESRWRWMFLESAKRLHVDPMVWFYRDSDSIVSHHGAIPVKVKIGEQESNTVWFVETMTLESYRSKGVGGMVLMEAKNEVPFNLSLGQEKFMRDMQFNLGWKSIGSLGVYFYPLRSKNILRNKLPKGPVSWGAAVALSTITAMKRVGGRPSLGWKPEIHTIEQFGNQHDELWKSVCSELTCSVVRDSSFLNWKYVAQPGQNFQRLEIRKQGEVVALAIVMIKEPTEAYPYRRAFLVDLIVKPSDSEAVWAILEAVRTYSIQENVDAIIFYLSCPALHEQLLSFGFRSKEPTRFLLVSTDGLNETIAELLSTMDNWYLTMGDSDLDRPW